MTQETEITNLDQGQVMDLLRKAKELAKEYRALTGKPLGITGEIAEFEAAYHLDLKLMGARQPGYDATEGEKKIQIKGRCIQKDNHKRVDSQRVGSVNTDKDKVFDSVLLVLLDENFDAAAIYEAKRCDVEAVLKKSNKRRDLSVGKFKSIAGNPRPLKEVPVSKQS